MPPTNSSLLDLRELNTFAVRTTILSTQELDANSLAGSTASSLTILPILIFVGTLALSFRALERAATALYLSGELPGDSRSG